jgi:plasmid stabilization system protein ParE
MATVRWTPTARRQYDEIQALAHKVLGSRTKTGKSKSSRQEGLFKQVRKTLLLLADNPRHPGLQTHPYHSLGSPFDPKAKVFEAYAQHRTPGAYRVFWCYGPGAGEITILAVTPHP